MTYRWSVDASTSTGCLGACTDGALMANIVEAVAGVNGGQQPTSGFRPVYKTNQVNGLPAAQFTYASHMYWGTSLPFGPVASGTSAADSVTFYAILKPQCPSSSFCGLNSYNGPAPSVHPSVSFALTSNSGATVQNMYWNVLYGTGAATETTTNISSTAFTTLVWTLTRTTGAYAFYQCASGTCTSLSSGTFGALTLNDNSTALGAGYQAGWWFNGYIAEIGYLKTSSTTAGIAAWSQCKYGI